MSRWIFRLVGILMILGFLLLFAHMQRQLQRMQETRRPAPVSR